MSMERDLWEAITEQWLQEIGWTYRDGSIDIFTCITPGHCFLDWDDRAKMLYLRAVVRVNLPGVKTRGELVTLLRFLRGPR